MTAPTLAVATVGFTALDAAYRAAVARVALAVATAMLNDWKTVQPDNLAGSSARWLAASMGYIIAGQRQAGILANSYTTQVRRLSIPGAPAWTPPPLPDPNFEQLIRSLVYTGIASTARELERARAVRENDTVTFDEEELEDLRDRFQRDQDAAATEASMKQKIMQDAIARAANAAVRHVTTAGHDQIYANVQSDELAQGWYRTTKAGCCYFCAMLASRGAVYKEDSFAESNVRHQGPGDQKVHDSCGCGLRPFYNSADPLPDQTEEFEKLWVAEGAPHSGAEAVKRFRQAYEGRKKPA